MEKQKEYEKLSLNDIFSFADGHIAKRGMSYQKRGAVKELAQSETGTIVAWVEGTRTYAVEMDIDKGKLKGTCTCPYFGPCKHQVAVVLEYLNRIEKGKSIPKAEENDERIGMVGDESESTMLPFQDTFSQPKEESNLEALNQYLQEKSKQELIQLVMGIAERNPEIKRAIQFKQNLGAEDIEKLIKQLKRDIREISSEPAWSSHWSNECNIPDYSPVCIALQDLYDTGHTDDLLEIGMYLMERGTRQLNETDDEGETAEEIGSCLEIVGRALKQSSLDRVGQMKWALEFKMQDQFELSYYIEGFWDDEFEKDEWSRFADYLLGKLKTYKSSKDYDHNRSLLANHTSEALEMSNRLEEALAIYQQEAVENNRYEKLVKVLINRGNYQEAHKWIVEGIKATRKSLPGIAKILVEKMQEIAKSSNDHETEASITADLFCDRPSTHTYLNLKEAAQQLNIWKETQTGVFHYLEKGSFPSNWPVKDSGLNYSPDHRQKDFPMIQTIIDLHIEEKRAEEVYRWYLIYRKQKRYHFFYSFEDQIAVAIQDLYADESIRIWKSIAENFISQVKPRAYESAITYLRKAMNLLFNQKRDNEWKEYLVKLRTEHSRKSSLIKLLNLFNTNPIIRRK